jgi:t-SNARE complex subunit (syntaxin)
MAYPIATGDALPNGALPLYSRLQEAIKQIVANTKTLSTIDTLHVDAHSRSQALQAVDSLAQNTLEIITRAAQDLKALRRQAVSTSPICETLSAHISTGLRRASSEFTAALDQVRGVVYEHDVRRLQTIGQAVGSGQSLTEQQIVSVIERGQTEQFAQAVLMMDSNERIADIVADMEERYDRILHLERSLLELQALVRDFALLMETQQESLDRIAESVQKTNGSVTKAETDLKDGERYQRKAAQKRNCIALVAAAGLVAVAAPTATVLATKLHSA